MNDHHHHHLQNGRGVFLEKPMEEEEEKEGSFGVREGVMVVV